MAVRPVGHELAVTPELAERLVGVNTIYGEQQTLEERPPRLQRRRAAAEFPDDARPEEPHTKLHPAQVAVRRIRLAVLDILARLGLLDRLRRALHIRRPVGGIAVPQGDFPPEIRIDAPGLIELEDPVHGLNLSGPDPMVAVVAPVVGVVRRAAAVPDMPVGAGPFVGNE